MAKKEIGTGGEEPPGFDMLRAIAGYPHQAVQAHRQLMRYRVLEIHRDQFGNVVGSVERIEEAEQASLTGDWSN